jgi:sulfur-oxidizing protein SoxA
MNVRSAIQFASAALALTTLVFVGSAAIAADTIDPAADAQAFQKYFTTKFPKLKLEDFVNGPYSLNEDMHRQWEEKEEFPPYEFSLDEGDRKSVV